MSEILNTIDMTPSWEALIPLFVMVLRNPGAPEDSVQCIKDELIRLARHADKQKEKQECT
tara:strand:- start:6125 stop:6304 length:180 start_codon:yes stop_codon:yes gene_type:complete